MIRAMVELLGNFYASNDLGNFEIIARSLNASVPEETVSMLFIGLARYRRGQVEDAVELFNEVSRLPPQPRTKDTNFSSIKIAKNKSLAITSFIEAARNDPNLAQIWYDLGTALRETGNNDGAMQAFQTAVTAKPEFADAILETGAAAFAAGHLQMAKESFLNLRSLQPNSQKAYLGLGMVYRKLRDFASAHACFIRARLLMGSTKGIDGLNKTAERQQSASVNFSGHSRSQ